MVQILEKSAFNQTIYDKIILAHLHAPTAAFMHFPIY